MPNTAELTAVGVSVEPLHATGEKYKYIGMVGSGAMGEVRLAFDNQLQRKVAIKQMSGTVAGHMSLVTRFFNEAQITAQLDHPNVVPVYGLETTDEGALGYSMKLVVGQTLEEMVESVRQERKAKRALPEELSLETRLEHFLKVCDAMAYSHARGVLHRDLKPANIMVGSYNEVYVMDWGIAKLLGTEEVADDTELPILSAGTMPGIEVHKTQLGHAIGTPSYMSPEQAKGLNDQLDARSDQFSLGLILYELTTLQKAYQGHAISVLMRAQEADIETVAHWDRGVAVDRDLKAIIKRATSLQPSRRYADVGELADDIRRYLHGEATLARPDSLFRSTARALMAYREAVLVLLLTIGMSAGAIAIGALMTVQAVQYASAVRQERLAYTLSAVADQASGANDYFLELQGLLEALAESAEMALQDTPADTEVALYMSPDFGANGNMPPDTVHVPRYGKPVSFTWPVFKLAPGVSEDSVKPELQRLIRLRRTFRSNFLRSESEEASLRTQAEVVSLLGHQGVPLMWSYVSTETGIHTSFPGHGPYPDAYDPRVRPWYKLGKANRGPVWGSPYIDVNGEGLILPCVQSLWSDQGSMLGVAGIELTFDLVIEDLLRNPAVPGADKAWLTDDKGRVVVGSADLGTEIGAGLHENKGLELKPLPVPAVLDAIEAEQGTGYRELDGTLTVFSRLDTLGWYLVVSGDSAAVLDGG